VLNRDGLHSIVLINWVTVFLERQCGTYFAERKSGRDGKRGIWRGTFT
jgi:hypothetical protein